MNLRSMTTVPKMLRLSHFLTVKTWKQIAPRLLDYLQPSSCFDHLKNEQASSKEVCLQETVELLLSRCRPSYCARAGSSGPFVLWEPGQAATSLLVAFLHYITTHFVHFSSLGQKDNKFHYLSFCKSVIITELNLFTRTMEIIAILKPISEDC